MTGALVFGRVGAAAVALGIGVAIAHGTAVAAADSPSRESASAQDSASSGAKRSAGPKARTGTQRPPAARPAASASSTRARTPSAAAVTAAVVRDPLAPDPRATVQTPYGDLGKWMINKKGQVADWVGIPYCTGDVCKTMQEPINTVFTVPAPNKFKAEATLNRTLRRAGFAPSCCSSVGYQGIVDQVTSSQMPRGGILGVGVLGPGFIERGLLGLLLGIGPAYRDASFLVSNSHLRTFGGVSDGAGNYIFTASVSKEYLDTSTGKPTHGYDSFDEARAALLNGMVGVGAQNLGLVEMDNKIPALDPTYSTGDHDGFAQVIALTGMASGAWRAPNRN